ncbi:hypothetical protein [Klebsiella aerogenes]|uniref:hypothetical protein n=1 Tax=Klebsiella aerogenes TaxID=548 RepID=UPI0005013224|nr:hypothetical protein [Klebsiella aerogenes]KGB05081.1 hypothetical protein DR72_865 [Klebsiella aerogenes]HBR0026529.1 hypothetical protein [Klebsiella aerogenes]HDS8277359.1 hypothetical protein [Klebsiella aerogenes]HDS8500386.1 hypothetical protein [Klebsiella aerogenes]HDU6103473.1 hypothetical protein [Klebsiella aerogenes]
MNISDFEQYEGYWEIIDENLFDEVFYINRIEKLEPTEKVIKAIELLSFLFTDDRMEMLEEVRQMNMLAQADMFDLWFDIIKSRDYVEAVAKTVIYYSIGMPV